MNSKAEISDNTLFERRSTSVSGTIWSYYEFRRCNSAIGGPNNLYYSDPKTLFIGMDSEYILDKDGQNLNRILSYQFHASSAFGEWNGIHYPAGKRRIKLSRFVGSVAQIGLESGLLEEWPQEIYLCAHFALADFPAFEDLSKLVSKMDTVRRTFVSLKKPIWINCYDSSKHKRSIQVYVRDSMLLAPAGMNSLKELGNLIGLDKLTLEQGQIERMDLLLSENPTLYEKYAIRDAEIAVKYCNIMREFNKSILNNDKIPHSLSSMGVELLEKSWANLGFDKNVILGKEKIQERQFNGQHFTKEVKEVSLPEVHMWESFVTECYHGGRNEQYIFGPGKIADWMDWDLRGAYTTAMSLIGKPEWMQIYHTRDLDEYQATSLGYARISFKFPADTRFPCLPVRTEAGLIFPLEGESYCCSPEIYLAKKMGASIKILSGIILPFDNKVLPFAEFIKIATESRKMYEKKSVFELVWKELGNGTYGKTAQGLRKRRCYSCRKDKYENLPPSKITNPYFAAWVTSFVRAVLGEILVSIPHSVSVCNATTDGILCTAPEFVMEACTNGPLCEMFKAGRYLIAGDRQCLDAKHSIRQPLGMRTRGQLTIEGYDGEKPVLAKAGIKPPKGDIIEQNEWMLSLFINRTAKTRVPVKFLRSIADICRKGGDLTPIEIDRAARLDYDWKRAPLNPIPNKIRDTEHLAFDTQPWRTASEAIACRDDWYSFSRSGDRVLRSVDDLHDFQVYRALIGISRPSDQGGNPASKPFRIPRKGGARKLAARQFLRAYVRSLGGLKKGDMPFREVALLISSLGVKTTKTDVENATRSNAQCQPNSLPHIPDVLDFLELLKQKFPGFDPEFLLTPPGGVQEDISLPFARFSNTKKEEYL